MILCKLLEYIPIRHFILEYKEEKGIKIAYVCENANIYAKYANLSKKDKDLFPYIENCEQVLNNLKNGKNGPFFVRRNDKLFKLAAIYYTEDQNGIKNIIDIHYIKNHAINGYRDIKVLIEDTDNILISLGYQLNDTIGKFICSKKTWKKNQGYNLNTENVIF